MTLLSRHRTAVSHLFQYLDARPGNLTVAYEDAYRPVAAAITTFAAETDREVTMIPVEELQPDELYECLTSAEKFLCAFNRIFESGLTERLLVMTERATTLSAQAYTLADMSAAFYDIFQACPENIRTLNAQLIRALQSGRSLIITDPNGTHLEVELHESFDWVNMDCFSEVDFDLTCNLPVGEVATYSPYVEGDVYFTGALLGTIPIGRKYGAVTNPIHFEIRENQITHIEAPDSALQRDLEFCLYFDDYTHFVNEIAVGTNDGVRDPILGFNYKYEENRWGFHMGFGASLAQQNVERLTPHHLDLVFDRSTVKLDGEVLFDGMYHLDRFPAAALETPLRLASRTCCGIAAAMGKVDSSGAC
jgi:hypothetical protein